MGSHEEQLKTRAEKRAKRQRKRQPMSSVGVRQLPRLIQEKAKKKQV